MSWGCLLMVPVKLVCQSEAAFPSMAFLACLWLGRFSLLKLTICIWWGGMRFLAMNLGEALGLGAPPALEVPHLARRSCS